MQASRTIAGERCKPWYDFPAVIEDAGSRVVVAMMCSGEDNHTRYAHRLSDKVKFSKLLTLPRSSYSKTLVENKAAMQGIIEQCSKSNQCHA